MNAFQPLWPACIRGVASWKPWHKATATPSVASSSFGMDSAGMFKVRATIAATCSFEAAPEPVMLCLTRRGAYSAMGTSRESAAASATPWARPSLSIDCTFLPKNGASTARWSGWWVSMSWATRS